MTVRVVDLLDLPDHVSKGDFVQSLAESLRHPERTVDMYAVTPELARNFRDALKVVGRAVSTRRSQPVFLHGSFGSGKSHFMAVLHLILQGHAAPWRKTALHPVREVYEPLAGKDLLQLHFHMLGARSLEDAVFAGYVAAVRDSHPDAPLPGLFRDQEVFENAASLRATMGDEAFFAALNQDKSGVAGFGSLGGAEAWTPARFDETLRSAEAAARRDLLTDLVNTLLPAFARQTDRFVDVDEGLGEMSRHAASLGYHGIVLYLDELILWLASQSADLPFVQREINKLVKLKEAQDEARDVPIVSFIARQRDLSQLLGEGPTGAERALIEETLGHHRSRFDTIELSDSNLRAIVPHRVVVAKTPDDRERLKDGFAAMWREAANALPVLQSGTADKADFAQVYPFSPALIDALIALSDRLQRDRTAIRILVEMLVDHLPDLALGEVVAVGDVFDLVASADDAVDGPSRAAFERARDLYLHELLPLIQQQNETNTAARCQRLREGHPVRIGCSGCPVTGCRNDNRLVKTLLLAALVPRARPFDGLTVKRLVHLNHGAVKAPVETMQVNLAATKLRTLARAVHALRVGDEADPAVVVSLQSIDLKPILERADDQDTRARRRYVLRKLLWEQLEIQQQDSVVPYPAPYRHTNRTGRVRFGNVRTLRAEELRCPDGVEWQVVVDYPFDEQGYTPHDDEQRLQAARDELRRTWTLAWLPTFFSRQVEEDLGDLARLDHILDPANLTAFLSGVPPDEHGRARIDLESLRGAKRREVIDALRKAYGLARPRDNDPHLDLDRTVSEHVHALDDRIDARTPRAAGLSEGLQDLAAQVLQARYPLHPNFQAVPSPMRLNRVREFLERLADSDGRLEQASSQERDDLQRIAEPLKLCRVIDQQVEWLDTVHDQVERERLQAGVESPTLGQVRGWIDPNGTLGLPETVANLVAWLWAVKARRVGMSGTEQVEWPPNARLSEHVVFTRPDLPDETSFSRALERAASVFGVTQPGKALNARNVARFATALRKLVESDRARASVSIPPRLQTHLADLGVEGGSHRLVTAQTLVALLAALRERQDRALVEGLAAVDLGGTSASALSRSWHASVEVAAALDGAAWKMFGLVRGLVPDPRYTARATALLDKVGQLLVDDELNASLPGGLPALVAEANELLRRDQPRGWEVVWRGARDEVPGGDALDALDTLRDELEARLAGGGEAKVSMRIEVLRRDGEDG